MRKFNHLFYLILLIVWVLFTIFIFKKNHIIHFDTQEQPNNQLMLYLKTKNNPHNFNYLINPGKSFCSKNLLLVAFVCISPSSFEQRLLIRRTWANHKQFPSIRAVFLLGLDSNKTINSMLVAESEHFGDIVQEDFIDTYDNLTLKSVMGLKWVSTFCSNSIFSLKIDDDVVVNTPVLIRFLENQITNGNYKNYYMGKLHRNAPILRTNNSKWFISRDEFNGKYYPLYNQGLAYMLTPDLAQKLYKTSLKTEFFRIEDAYVGYLANRIGAKFVALNKFYWYLPKINTTSISQSQATNLFVYLNHNNSFENIWLLLIRREIIKN